MPERGDNLWTHTTVEGTGASELTADIAADVLIIGGGFTGCSAALHLAESGVDVCLLEARTVGHGGSGRNVGLVNAGLWLEPESVERILGPRAGARLNDALASGPAKVFSLIDGHQICCDATRSGTLHCAHSKGGLANLEERLRQYTARGWDVEFLDYRETTDKTGTTRYLASLWDRRAGTVQPLAYARGLARAAIACGAELFEMSPVNALEYRSGRWTATTPGGSVCAEAVLLATNAYHQGLRHAAEPGYIPVNYFQMATAPLPRGIMDSILPGRQGAWDTMQVMSSFRLDAERRLVLGAVGSLDGFGRAVHSAWARRRLDAIYPGLAGCDFEYAWSGRIAMTSDHVPRVLEFGERALSVYGYSGRGIAPGTVFGASVAAYLLSGDADELPLEPVEVHREVLSSLKQFGYELGATAFHMADSRRKR